MSYIQLLGGWLRLYSTGQYNTVQWRQAHSQEGVNLCSDHGSCHNEPHYHAASNIQFIQNIKNNEDNILFWIRTPLLHGMRNITKALMMHSITFLLSRTIYADSLHSLFIFIFCLPNLSIIIKYVEWFFWNDIA